MRQAISLDRITVGTGWDGTECLHVWATSNDAVIAVRNSPIADDQMASTRTYHRVAAEADVARLIYDRDGNEVVLISQPL